MGTHPNTRVWESVRLSYLALTLMVIFEWNVFFAVVVVLKVFDTNSISS